MWKKKLESSSKATEIGTFNCELWKGDHKIFLSAYDVVKSVVSCNGVL